MSTRASLFADPSNKAVEIAESVSFLPLLWVALLSTDDVKRVGESDGYATTDTDEAIARCAGAVDFLFAVFPEFEEVRDTAVEFLDYLRTVKAKTLGVEFRDFRGILPRFLSLLEVAVKAIQSKSGSAKFKLPGQTFRNPQTGEEFEFGGRTVKTTRDLLEALSVPVVDGDQEELADQLVGYVFTLKDRALAAAKKKKKKKTPPTKRKKK